MWIRRHPILAGLAGGLTWGASLRAWMRFISTHHEFTWSGTLFILGASTFVGGVLGMAWWRRARGGRGWWRMLGVGILPVFAGAGVVMLPSALLGAMGIGRTRWRPLIRGGLVVAALSAQPVLLGAGDGQFPPGRTVPALALYAVMIGCQMWAVSILFRPALLLRADRSDGALADSRWRGDRPRDEALLA